MKTPADIRPSPIAGLWYTDDPRHLADSVDRYISQAKLPPLEGEVVAVMAPHAGHRYSGPVAGYAFAALRGLLPELVAVVSPIHDYYPAALLTTAHHAYETPLGVIPVDLEALIALDERLEQTLGIRLAAIRRDSEHSLEIELPFLQRALAGAFKLLPIMVLEQSVRVAQELGKALAEVLRGKPALLVGSTDLSHFYAQDAANKYDAEVLRCVEAFDPEGVIEAEERGKGFACGRGALAAVMWAAKELGADRVTILNHATSGDVTGDYRRVVGYGAAVMFKSK